MFVYTVYGVTGQPGRAQSRRVDPVSPTSAVHPTTRSWVTQQNQEGRLVHGVYSAQADQKASPTYDETFRLSADASRTAEPKSSTSLNYLENGSSLVLSYRKPKSILNPNFSGHIEKLNQVRRENFKPTQIEKQPQQAKKIMAE